MEGKRKNPARRGPDRVSFNQRSLVLDELAGLQLVHGLIQLGLGVHHDGAVPGDWLLERLAGDEQEADAFRAGLDDDLVAAVEQNERMVFRVVLCRSIRIDRRLGQDGFWI